MSPEIQNRGTSGPKIGHVYVYNSIKILHFLLYFYPQKFNKESVLQEFQLAADERVVAVYKRPYPFFWHERYGDERTSREPESPGGIEIKARPLKLSSQCELTSHTVLDGCMVLTNQALYKCRPRYVTMEGGEGGEGGGGQKNCLVLFTHKYPTHQVLDINAYCYK